MFSVQDSGSGTFCRVFCAAECQPSFGKHPQIRRQTAFGQKEPDPSTLNTSSREARRGVSWAAIIHLGGLLPGRSSTLPAAQKRRAASRCLFGLAGGGVCPAIAVTRDAVRSYRTFSPLPLTCGEGFTSPARDRRAKPEPHVKGGIFSVALSLGLRRVAVSNHRALPSSDFPPGRVGTAHPKTQPGRLICITR